MFQFIANLKGLISRHSFLIWTGLVMAVLSGFVVALTVKELINALILLQHTATELMQSAS